jgi:23S rRNA pseudouridine955/2504/2580 synthase
MEVTYLDIVNVDDVGQRIDNFLLRHLKGVPRAKIYRILRKGEVRVNGGRIKPTYRLALNDRVRVPPIRSRKEAPVQLTEHTAQILECGVLFEDDDLIVINKPPGFAVHGGSSITSGIIEMFRLMRNLPRLELAHRIDRDTSGCLLMCKKRSVLKVAQQAFRDRIVKKKYHLIVDGVWPRDCRNVHLRLKRYETAAGERRVRVDGTGQIARTDFEITDVGERATLLAASLHTGRTHQIRVHARAQHHAILGDAKYGSGNTLEASRLCLHSSRLVVPFGGNKLDISAPLEEEMASIWRQLSTRQREER